MKTSIPRRIARDSSQRRSGRASKEKAEAILPHVKASGSGAQGRRRGEAYTGKALLRGAQTRDDDLARVKRKEEAVPVTLQSGQHGERKVSWVEEESHQEHPVKLHQ